MSFLEILITLQSGYINKDRLVGRPPLRSYLTADMEATQNGRTCTTSNGSWCMGIKGEMSGTRFVSNLLEICMYVCIYVYIYIYINIFKTTRSFRYQWFRVSTHQANATKHGKKSNLNLWIVVNRKKCKRFLSSKPIMRRNYIHTFIYERSFLVCQTFQISNFTSIYTQLTSQNAHTGSYKATYHDKDTIYY